MGKVYPVFSRKAATSLRFSPRETGRKRKSRPAKRSIRSFCTRVSSWRQGGHHVAQKLSSTTLPRSSESVRCEPSNRATEKSGAGSPTLTSVVLSLCDALPFALRLPHEGSRKITAMMMTISASITHSCPLLFFFLAIGRFVFFVRLPVRP